MTERKIDNGQKKDRQWTKEREKFECWSCINKLTLDKPNDLNAGHV
jgi:hypothetical protein